MRSEALAAPRGQVPLAPLTTLQVGGAAEWYVRATSVQHVQLAHRWAEDRGLAVLVLGGGSNLVVADAGVNGLVLHIGIEGVELTRHGDEAVLHAGAGEPWDRFVSRIVDAGFSGVESLSGIPGLVGGTPIQNVGAYGQEVATTIERVIAFDAAAGELREIAAADCGFSYRQSRFKLQDAGRYTICRVSFRMRREPPSVTYPDVVTWMEQNHLPRPTVADVRCAVLEIRERKGMVLDPADSDTRSAGSFFMNPIVPAAVQDRLGCPCFPIADGRVKVPAAWLIERAGFAKGYAAGAAAVSSKHPLALVNRGGATAGEIVDLACRIKQAVADRFGIALRPEPIFAGFGDDPRVRFLQRESLY